MVSKINGCCKWNGTYSSCVNVTSGVRQGGVLSPALFNLYVNCLIVALRKLDHGCHLHGMYVGCIMYADDLLLLSGSMIDLQLMLNKCSEVGEDLGITFNAKKSKCIVVGNISPPSAMANLEFNKVVLQWDSKFKYLGLWLCSAKHFSIDLSEVRRKFFASVNSILYRCKFTSDMCKLKLIESHCLPIILYSIESLNLKRDELSEINSWWNSGYRKIFNYNKWESVKEVICLSGRLDILHIENLRRINFVKSMLCISNSNHIVRHAVTNYCRGGEFISLLAKYNIYINWSFSKIKAFIFMSFRQQVADRSSS